MMIGMDQVKTGLLNYMDQELGRKATGANKFLVYFAMPSIVQNADKMVSKISGNPLFSDVVDENGCIDIDTAYSRAKDAIRKCGTVKIWNVIFSEGDVDSLYQHIMGIGGD